MTNVRIQSTGIVKFYSADVGYGYGYIVNDENGTDIAIHTKELNESGLNELNRGDRVRYVQNRNGIRFFASDIELL